MKTYNVCWTGGLDSTLVVTQLSQFPVTIRPFYIKGQTYRLSEPQELEAITSIRKQLLEDPRTKAELLPISIIEKDDPRIKDREIIKAHRYIYMHLLKEYKVKHQGKLPPAGSQQIYADGAFISPQYIACASLAKFLGEPIEIGFLCSDLDHIPVFQLFSTSITLDNTTGQNFAQLCECNSDMDAYRRCNYMLFKDFQFPLVGQNMDKHTAWKWYADHDYLGVRSKTITCQSPIIHPDGTWEPCGVCNCCISVIHLNLLEPFTEEGLARYRDYEENHEKEPERFRLKGF